ncbi:hypothetical protein MO867_21055 [Microbulbifer sp. OS29]|uniref:Uncharacterized protein n=1 Tax=Microbulbifer okhotskensis TaxID=2926617 RepID=A0A9X2ES81_9GAMM|nr:hypothetical protein [Microbulbifer okhotskensis]MCO1336820.1 hypothetical protein [Microbulbifer okhotskensis]
MLSRLFASRQRPFIPRRHERERIAIDLSGSRLAFSLPPNVCHDSFADPSQEPPQSVNIFDNSNYFDDSGYEDWEREGVASQTLMKRRWELFGPIWRGRPIGYISFVLTLNRHDALPKDMSCLNPQHFEQVIMRTLYYCGPCRPNHKVQQAPVNWQLRELDGTTAIFFEEHQQHSPESLAECPHHDTHFSNWFFIPLDQRHYVDLHFSYLGYAPVEPCLKAMNSLRDSICDSVKLQLGVDAKTQLSKAQQQWPRAKASAKRDIEPWVYPEWRRGGEFGGDIIITKPGSPPPAWQV